MTGYKIKFNGIDRLYKEYSWRLTRRAKQVWESGNVLQGNYLEQFEKELAKKYKRKYAVAVANATDGLYFALRCANITKNDSVICPALSYIATSGAIRRIGCNIDFVDTDKNGNIDVLKISNMEMPKALLYVNLFGNVSEYETLRKICDKRGIVLIEDAAQSQGAKYKNKLSGSLGDLSVFSFDPMKNMPSFGGGGMVLTDNKEQYNKIISLRKSEMYNSLIAEDHANQLLLILDKFDKLQRARKKVYKRYKDNMPNCTFLIDESEKPSYHKLVMLTDNRDELALFLTKNGIETKVHYSKILDDKKVGDFQYPMAEGMCQKVLSLPIYPHLKFEEVDYICETIGKFNV